MKKSIRFFLCVPVLAAGLIRLPAEAQTPPEPANSVFEMPRVFPYHQQLMAFMVAAARANNYAEAERACREAVRVMPQNPLWHYNLACTLARQGKVQEALDSLEHAIRIGFRNAQHIQNDADFERLRPIARFNDLIELVRTLGDTPPEGIPQKKATPIVNGRATVEESNTIWNFEAGIFQTVFELPETPLSDTVTANMGDAGNLVNQWYRDGTAAGNHGDFYDNRDNAHSPADLTKFPQVTRIVYGEDAKAHQAHWGLSRFLFNGTVVGNSSTASTAGPLWRSTGRMAYTDARQLALLLVQYTSNHLYLYPSHHDYSPGPQAGKHHGDVFPANTPYILISQGSSYTDKPFMDAVFLTLAAFRPDVKQFLRQNRMLMSTVQMILRGGSKNVKTMQDYLSGTAHPVAFEKDGLDLPRMVRLAQSMTTNTLPAFVQLEMQEEERMVAGKDFFDAASAEALFNSPAAIARILRGTPFRRRYVVSAENSHDPVDPSKRSLRFHWSVLQGDPQKVSIRPLDDRGTKAEILVDYHTPFPVRAGSNIFSTRVDVGVFAHNGHQVSAPGFVSFFFLPNEDRVYHSDRRILSVDYETAMKRYADPLLSLPRGWKDVYNYTPQGKMIGWTRTWSGQISEFTADGFRVETTDARGRPLTARNVTYTTRRDGSDEQALPEVIEALGNQRFHYAYENDADRIGRVVNSEEVRD